MKVAYNHLIEYISSKPSIEELSSRLFQLGHEHEISDNIFELEFTPNRGDCLSLRGLLRDLNLFYEVKINESIYKKDIQEFNFKFKNNAEKHCQVISFLKIEIDEIPVHYNNYLESYFTDLALNKNNFFTDVSNYISYETGQPTHCYDSSQVGTGLKLDFLYEDNFEFKTLLDKTIMLQSKNLVFCDSDNNPVNLAGIIGDNRTACKKDTLSIIVECAHFDPEVILGKSVQHAINSDAAYKFERNTDPDCHEYVLRRFLKVVEDHTKVLNVELFTQKSKTKTKTKTKIVFDPNKINNILGSTIEDKAIISYLEALGFIIDKEFIIVPSHRNDILSINDISEEIARAVGYDNIKSQSFIISPRNKSKESLNENKIKNFLIENGFNEVINNPFVAIKNKDSLCVVNPLDSNRKYLRTKLKDSLLENLLFNERRQKDCIKLFEISDVYSSDLMTKKRVLGVIGSGRVGKNYIDFSKKINSNYFLELFDGVFKNFQSDNIEILSREKLDTKLKSEIPYMEINLDGDFDVNHDVANLENNIDYQYKKISDFPSSIRDLSFSLNDASKLSELEKWILNFENQLLKEVFVFDYYVNENINVIKIGFRFVFQSNSKTITEPEVNAVIKEITEHVLVDSDISIQGL